MKLLLTGWLRIYPSMAIVVILAENGQTTEGPREIVASFAKKEQHDWKPRLFPEEFEVKGSSLRDPDLQKRARRGHLP